MPFSDKDKICLAWWEFKLTHRHGSGDTAPFAPSPATMGRDNYSVQVQPLRHTLPPSFLSGGLNGSYFKGTVALYGFWLIQIYLRNDQLQIDEFSEEICPCENCEEQTAPYLDDE